MDRIEERTPRLTSIDETVRDNRIVMRNRHTSPVRSQTLPDGSAYGTHSRSPALVRGADARLKGITLQTDTMGVKGAIGSWDDGVSSAVQPPADRSLSALSAAQSGSPASESVPDENYLDVDFRRLNKQTLVMGATTPKAVSKYRNVLEEEMSVPRVKPRSVTPPASLYSKRSQCAMQAERDAQLVKRKANESSSELEMVLAHAYRHDWLATAQQKLDREKENRDRQLVSSQRSATRTSKGVHIHYPEDRNRRVFKPTGFLKDTPSVVYARRMKEAQQKRAEEEKLLGIRQSVIAKSEHESMYQRCFSPTH
eukprot:ANDGO_05505.mRNA.1 hypothetical protein